jgi:hypothetical protein
MKMSTPQISEWSPPLETGLTADDVYLSEQMDYHAQEHDELDDPADAYQTGCYVLELSLPVNAGRETLSRLWLSHRDVEPEYMDQIMEAERLLYVGAAPDESEYGGVWGRIREHLEHPNRSTTIAEVFPIHHVEAMYFYESGTIAKEREESHAMDMQLAHPEAYVHSR